MHLASTKAMQLQLALWVEAYSEQRCGREV